MAALLPHQQIDYAQGVRLYWWMVVVPGLDNRSAILAKVGALRYQAKSPGKVGPALRPMRAIGDARVIYVYHDVIDAIGDKQATEQQTFSAVRQAIHELNNLVSKIINAWF